MSARHLKTGREGENLAADLLREKGWRIVERNFRCSGGELDLVCEDGRTLVFVEVKARSGVVRGEPGDAVDRKKVRRLVRAASEYLSLHKCWDRPCRFDLVSVIMRDGETTVEHWEDIIDARDGLDCRHASWQPW